MPNREVPDPDELWTADEARVVLEQLRQSGASVAAFARQQKVTPQRIYWWKKRLKPAPMDRLALVPATLVSIDPTPVGIAIRLPNGISIELTSASPTWIATVVAELSRTGQ